MAVLVTADPDGELVCLRRKLSPAAERRRGAALALKAGSPRRASPHGCRRRAGLGGARPVSYTHLTLPTICSV
eukprot:5031063-Alexandrium_andersonii.AAC.1